MSRLDIFIRRMQAQRACIDEVAGKISGLAGPVLELGLGNGRTYDHLRSKFPDRNIYVFDREIAAHPDCVPPERFCRLGDFRTTMPAFLDEGHPAAAFIHADIGTSDREASTRLATDLAPSLLNIMAPGAFLGCDQPVTLSGLEELVLPNNVGEGRYHFYRRLI